MTPSHPLLPSPPGTAVSPLPSRVLALADLPALGPDLAARAADAAAGGVRWVCVRARGAPARDVQRAAAAVLARCPGVFLSIHGLPGVARRLGAPGVHLPGGGDPAAAAGLFVGVSCHGRADLEAATRAGADYAVLSPVYAPSSKPPSGPLLGPDGFRRVAAGAGLPVLALAGITPGRVAAVAGAGAAGVAVLGSLFGARDVAGRARAYLDAAAAAWPVGPGPHTTDNPTIMREGPP